MCLYTIVPYMVEFSSVARGLYTTAPLIGLSAKMQKKKNTKFLALLRLFFCTGMD